MRSPQNCASKHRKQKFDLPLKAKRELSDVYLKLIDERKAISKGGRKSDIETVLALKCSTPT